MTLLPFTLAPARGFGGAKTCNQFYHNFVWPHASLRVPLPDVSEGTASMKSWQQRTPAMAAGLTDRGWSLREVRMYRVPPWPQPQVGEGPGKADDRHPPLVNCVNTPLCGGA
jgi:hypothetical protein